MAQHQLKIKGVLDFSDAKKSVDELSTLVENTLGKEIKFFDTKNMTEFSAALKASIIKSKQNLSELTKELKDISKTIKESNSQDKETNELLTKRAEILKKINQEEKNINVFKSGVRNVPSDGRRPSALGAAGNIAAQGATGVGSQLPVVGEAMKVGGAAISTGSQAASAGMSAGAIVGLGALAAAAVAAAGVVSHLTDAFQAYQETLPSTVRSAGMGIASISSGVRRGHEALGYSTTDMLDAQQGTARAFGSKGNVGNQTLNMMTASRLYGMDVGQLTGQADQMRQMGGTNFAQQQMGQMLRGLETSVGKGFDRSQATSLLSASVGLLAQINSEGLGNTKGMTDLIASMSKSGAVSPELAAKRIGGMSQAIAGSSGEANAFFQMAAAKQGLGGGSILGTKFAVSQGLVGADLGQMQSQFGDTKMGRMGIQATKEMGLGDEGYRQKMAGGILGNIRGMFNENDKGQRAAMLDFTNKMFGGRTTADATKTLALLEKISSQGTKALTKEEKRAVEDLGKDPQQRWQDQALDYLKYIPELKNMKLQAELKDVKIDLGKEISSTMLSLQQKQLEIDQKLLELLGADTRTPEQKSIDENASMGTQVTTWLEKLFNSSEEMKQIAQEKLKQSAKANEERKKVHVTEQGGRPITILR